MSNGQSILQRRLSKGQIYDDGAVVGVVGLGREIEGGERFAKVGAKAIGAGWLVGGWFDKDPVQPCFADGSDGARDPEGGRVGEGVALGGVPKLGAGAVDAAIAIATNVKRLSIGEAKLLDGVKHLFAWIGQENGDVDSGGIVEVLQHVDAGATEVDDV